MVTEEMISSAREAGASELFIEYITEYPDGRLANRVRNEYPDNTEYAKFGGDFCEYLWEGDERFTHHWDSNSKEKCFAVFGETRLEPYL